MKRICITGGTGSLGKAIINHLIKNNQDYSEVVVFSRDEQKHYQLNNELKDLNGLKVKYVLGDVRDIDSLRRAFEGVDYIIHAAANKHVHIAESNPFECIKTNVDGARNVIIASKEMNVSKVVALSTDKACSPINLYGASKLVSDKLFISASSSQQNGPIFSVVRYGNVLGSNGSVVPYFNSIKNIGIIPITNLKMTRFNILMKDAIKMIFYALENAQGGELYIPKLFSYKVVDLAKAIAPNSKINVIGIRPGEKLHEEMISASDSFNTYELDNYYVIIPKVVEDLGLVDKKWTKVPQGFSYNSEKNNFLTVEELRKMINENLG